MRLVISGSRAAVLAVTLAAAALSGCAGGARPDNMVASTVTTSPVSQAEAGYKSFRIARVDGGNKTNPLWMSSVASEDFQKAMEISLRAAGLLADDPAAAKAEISASLKALDRPMAGLDLTVASTVYYSATSTSDQKVVFDEVVTAKGTAKFGDSLLAVERLRLANEAATKENIREFIDRLRKSLSGAEVAAR